MVPNLNNAGYQVVWLRDKGKAKIKLIHRLVAEAFCRPIGDEVNHKDGNKLNNCASNLEWVTRQQNVDHAFEKGLINRKLSKEQVLMVQDLYKSGWTQKRIASLVGVTDVLISQLLRGKLTRYSTSVIKHGGRHEFTNR